MRVGNLEISPEFDGYTRVVIWLDAKDDNGDDLFVEAGMPTGRTLELTCPWGTQQMADAILRRINVGSLTGRAFQYQPYTATEAILDPAAELGDGVGIKDIYSGIYSQTEHFGRRHISDIEAPTEEEIDHEYPFESSDSRKTDRRFSQERAERISDFRVLSDGIEARVSKEYDNESETFGWRLTENQFSVYSGSPSNYVLKVTSDGLRVKGNGEFTGTVTANAGKIGNFTIENGVLRYNKTSLTDANTGVFLSQDGLALGKSSAFKVDSSGNLTIGNGKFTVDSAGNVSITQGTISIGNGAFSVNAQGQLSADSGTFKGNVYAKNIQYNGSAGTFNGAGLTGGTVSGGKITDGAITTGKITDKAVTESKLDKTYLAKATYDSLLGGGVTASKLSTQKLSCSGDFTWHQMTIRSYSVTDNYGTNRQVLGYTLS